MSGIYEMLFCPQHGLLRPDNFLALYSGLQVTGTHMWFWLRKAGLV